MIVSFLLCFIIQLIVIKYFKNFSSPIKDELDEHFIKAGTPHLGSIGLIISFIIALLLNSFNKYSLIIIIISTLFFLIGFIDDILKVNKKSADGLKSLEKLILQVFLSFISVFLINKILLLNLNYFYSSLYICVIVNAVNITDGLDTLASKCSLAPLLLIACTFTTLKNPALILISSIISFIIFNSKPAKIFMGDAGSHFIGSLIALFALLSGNSFILLLSLAPFLLELGTSFLQILYFRLTKKRLFLIAPFHHLLQKKGMYEETIVDTFFAFSVFFTLITYRLLV